MGYIHNQTRARQRHDDITRKEAEALLFLGVSSAGGTLWLGCVEAGKAVDTDPTSLALPTGMESGAQLEGLLDDAKRVLNSLAPARILILDPESNNQLNYNQSRGRLIGETLIGLAAAQLDFECARISRSTVRARLDLPTTGALHSHAGEVVQNPLNPSWKNKRDLAVMTALAAEKGNE